MNVHSDSIKWKLNGLNSLYTSMIKMSVLASLAINIITIALTLTNGYRAPVSNSNYSKYRQRYSYRSTVPSELESHLSETSFINISLKDYTVLDNIVTTTDNRTGISSQSEYFNINLLKGFRFTKSKESDKQNTQELATQNDLHRTNNSQIMDSLNMLTENDFNNEYLSNIELSRREYKLPNLKLSSNLKLDSAMENLSLDQKLSSLTKGLQISVQANSMNPVTLSPEVKQSVSDHFYKALDQLERKFYWATFTKLTSISPADRRENGISFVQSTLFLQLMLIALSTEVDEDIRKEINECLGLQVSYKDKLTMISSVVSTFPQPNIDLKFYWSSRLALWPGRRVSERFKNEIAASLRLTVDSFNGTETPEQVAQALNYMVETDSGGAIHDTFDEDEISDGIQAIMLTTLYLRARWRSAPTLLNGTRLFRDAEDALQRYVRSIRINDIMGYADLTEWDAEAVEIFYATPGLSLLLLIPRGRSLRRLADMVTETSISEITRRMHTLRIGAILPLYTLRMTLLLPNKLDLMGISKLMGVNVTNGSFALSHAVQRIMFWAEAGRNAFKDDGVEWDEVPRFELIVDRPYIFFVRWNNITIMNGNFVL